MLRKFRLFGEMGLGEMGGHEVITIIMSTYLQ